MKAANLSGGSEGGGLISTEGTSIVFSGVAALDLRSVVLFSDFPMISSHFPDPPEYPLSFGMASLIGDLEILGLV